MEPYRKIFRGPAAPWVSALEGAEAFRHRHVAVALTVLSAAMIIEYARLASITDGAVRAPPLGRGQPSILSTTRKRALPAHHALVGLLRAFERVDLVHRGDPVALTEE
jgi:hypothetical protein